MTVNHIAAPMRRVTHPGESSRTQATIIKACDGRGIPWMGVGSDDDFTAKNQEEATCSECKKLSNEQLNEFRGRSRGLLLQCIKYKKAFEKGNVDEAMRILEDDYRNYDDGKR